ncbi:MAG: NAD-dependent epimerase/dehydratase family protein [Pirellulaceae bacterium]
MHALVTGAGGFLGQYIVEQLVERGDTVRTFSRKAYAFLDDLGVETVQGDVRDAAAVNTACSGIDVVFHVAAVAGIWGPWEHFHEINTTGTRNVVAGCRKNDVPRLVYTSSPSVTFDGTEQVGVDETAPYPDRWLSHYPHSKALAEQHVLESNCESLRACSLRPHLIWGPRDSHLIPQLLGRARKGKLVQVGDGTNLVDMVYVENAAHAHLQAADALGAGSTVCGRAYFISQGEPVHCWQWINEILGLAGLPAVKRSISYRAAYRAGFLLEVVYRLLRIPSEPRMTRFLASQLATSHYFDIRRARDDFGYHPKITTAEGMRRLENWIATNA